MVRKEPGSSISYSICYIGILLTFTFFAFFTIQQKSILIKQLLEDGVQICECYVLAKEYDENDMGEQDRERYRRQIIPSFQYDPSETVLTLTEIIEVQEVAMTYAKMIKNHFTLDEHGCPTSRVYSDLISQINISEFSIIEAVYSNNAIIGYVRYDIVFQNNEFLSCSEKTYLPADAKLNGHPLNGSTIYSGITASFNVLGKIKQTTQQYVAVDIVQYSDGLTP